VDTADRAPLCLALGLSLLFIQKVDLASYLRNQADQNTKFAQLPQDRQDETFAFSRGFGALLTWVERSGSRAADWRGRVFLLARHQCCFGSGIALCHCCGGGGARADAMGLLEVVALILLALKPPGMLDTQNLVKTSLGAYLPTGSPAWLVSLGGSLELFWIWSLALICHRFVDSQS